MDGRLGRFGEEREEWEEAGMLVLDRRVQQGFWIDNRIFVKVLKISRHRIKIGIEAPKDVVVVREELRVHPDGEQSNGRDVSLAKGKFR